jgi:DNA repair protein RecO (recombination protein O)
MRTSTSFSSDGFILHRYPYKETSYILETFTRTHGRVAMVAKGAKRNGANKYALNAFQPITIDWFGRADLKTLKAAGHNQIYPQLRGSALMAAFYVNELILKLAVKDDAHEVLFDAYNDLIAALSQLTAQLTAHGREIEIHLRRFELTMLAELGYALTLEHEADSTASIDATLNYWYVVEHGPVRHVRGQEIRAHEPILLSGQTLCALAEGQLDLATPAEVLTQAKQLMRRVINHHLGDRALFTRQLIREMK